MRLLSLSTVADEAARERGVAVALPIANSLLPPFRTERIGDGHAQMQHRRPPSVLVAARLAILPGLVGESESYVERLFSIPAISALP